MAYTYYKFRCIVCRELVTEGEYFNYDFEVKGTFESCNVKENVIHCGKVAQPIPFRGRGSHPDDHTGELYHCGPVLGHEGGR